MTDPARTMKLDALKDCIARDAYVVDVDAVADAILRRARHARAGTLLGELTRNGARSREARAPRPPR